MKYEISGTPTPWQAHQGYGKRSYAPHAKAKTKAQWELTIQYKGRPLIERAVRVGFFFEMPIPSTYPRKFKAKILEGQKVYHDKRPDRSNLEKFAADALIGTVLSDDNIIVAGETQKYYAVIPKTLIVIEEI